MNRIVTALFLALFSLAGQAQVMNSIEKKLCEITHSKINLTSSVTLSDQYDRMQAEAYDYDFCEENVDGVMLYYRYVEQVVKRQEPIQLQRDPFLIKRVAFRERTLHVPAGSANRYSNAQYWSDFSSIVEEPTGINLQEFNSNSKRRTTPVKRLVNGMLVIETE